MMHFNSKAIPTYLTGVLIEDAVLIEEIWYICENKCTVNGERFAGLNFCRFHPMKFFTGKLSRCLTFATTPLYEASII